MKKGILFVLKVLFSVFGFILIYFFVRGDIGKVWHDIVNADILKLFSGGALYMVITVFGAYRLRFSLLMYEIDIPLLKVWKLNFIGYFFNVFLPSSIGGDIGKAYYIYKSSGKKAASFLAVFGDRIIGLISVVSLCVIAALINYKTFNNPSVLIIVFVLFFLIVSFIMMVFNKKLFKYCERFIILLMPNSWENKFVELFSLVEHCRTHKEQAFKSFLSSLAFQVVSISAISLIGFSIGINLSVFTYFTLIPLVYIFSMLPSINGLGVREGAFVYFFGFFVSKESAFALSILFAMVIYSESLIGLFCYLFHKEIHLKELKHFNEK